MSPRPLPLRTCVAVGAVFALCVALGAGCGASEATVPASRPDAAPTSVTLLEAATATKIDILFDVDNSSSMGDKQQYLQAAIPDLIARLVTPNCVDSAGHGILSNGVQVVSDAQGHCAVGKAQFAPVRDMHLGVVTSSLGPRGTTSICQTMSTPGAVPADYLVYLGPLDAPVAYIEDGYEEPSIPKFNDDEAHLINRTARPSMPWSTPGQLSGDFLAWVPAADADVPSDAVVEATAASLASDLQSVVIGAGAFGCGLESQLESWYRFLIQPDPYQSIVGQTSDAENLLVGSWSGVDTTILQQRADFLRPDSAVLVVVLSDENDSEIDVRTIGGIGVNWLDNNFEPPLATSVCATDPASALCRSCAFDTAPDDPNCMMNPPVYSSTAAPNWGFNDNLRHVHMKQKYGIDLQFPIDRYVLGLTSQKVPNRSGEYPSGGSGYYQGGLAADPIDLNCVNPLFAHDLPTSATGPDDPAICDLARNTATGTRTPASNLVYYAHIGGVPNELLTTTDSGGNPVPKETLTASDWMSILGQDPLAYDYTGVDPHMIESYQPRTGLPITSSGATIQGDLAPDWYTDGEASATFPQRVNLPVDREYACVFALTAPRNCDPNNENNSEADLSQCDCSTAGPGGTPPTLPADHVPPLCDAQNPLQQDYAKAYPTIRELTLAQQLGTQGIVSSICPIDVVDNAAGNDPLYGYRPAVASIVDRMAGSLAPLD